MRLGEEQRKVGEAVRAERQRLSEVPDTPPVWVVLVAPDHQLSFSNRYFREQFGKCKGRRWHEFLFGRDEPCEVCAAFTVLRSGQPHAWFWIGPDSRDHEVHGFPFTDSDGSSLVPEMGVDSTERRSVELEVRVAIEDSAARANQLRALASEMTLS
jgi:hypothetical protein